MLYRTVSLLAATGAALACASAQALAQAPVAPAAVQPLPRTQVAQKLDAEFKALDTNGDGKLTRAEVQAAIQKRAAEAEAMLLQRQKQEFDKLDTNKDGRLTLAEYQAGTTIKAKDNAADVRMGSAGCEQGRDRHRGRVSRPHAVPVRQARQEQGWRSFASGAPCRSLTDGALGHCTWKKGGAEAPPFPFDFSVPAPARRWHAGLETTSRT